MMAYTKYKKHKLGVNRKTKNPTLDKGALEKLAATTKDPIYRLALERSAIDKVKSAFVDGVFKRLESNPLSQQDGRLHGQITFNPSTMRTSMVDPNLQQVVARSESEGEDLASGFRQCIVPEKGCVLVEADFAGIEAVITGWCCGDPEYIRLAKLGVHGYVTAHLLGNPPDLGLDDTALGKILKAAKVEHPHEYNQCKRVVHGTNYGLTPFGMHRQFPKEFPTIASAERITNLYFKVAPKLKPWQRSMQEFAHKNHYIGGLSHPFQYKHWFWAVYSYAQIPSKAYYALEHTGTVTKIQGKCFRVAWGPDSKRVVAFNPQSIAAGVIKEVCLRLFADPKHPSYIGDAFKGRTPLRALIHDSLLLEIPITRFADVMKKLLVEMTRPVEQLPLPDGSHLSIGVEAKVGRNWAKKSDKNPSGMVEHVGAGSIGVASDVDIEAEEEE
jgi:DNA polymerase I-like protein with 3'-5' exonuclease and polymerase domains